MAVKHKSIFVFSLVIVAMFCVLGIFARPMPFDEYGFYNAVAGQGFVNANISSYLGWTGRVLNTFLMYTCALFRLENVQPYLPFITVITYILAAFSLIGALFPSLTSRAKVSLSFLACAMTLCFTFSLHETFYWLPGMPYFWAGTLIILATSLAVKAFRGSRSSFILCMIILFLNGTNLEQACVYQGIAAFLVMIFFMLRGERKRALMAGAFWLASVAGFCTIYFAPGTSVRMEKMNVIAPHPSVIKQFLRGFVSAFSLGVLNTFQFFAKPIIYTVIFFMPMIAEKVPAVDERLSRKARVWHIVAVMFIIAMFMQYMMGFIGGGGLPPRGVSLSLWLLAFTWVMFWVFVYRGSLVQSVKFRNFCAKSRWLILIVSVLISANFRECVSAFRTAPDYYAEWQTRIDMILSQREKGITNLRVPPLKTKPALIFSDIDPNAEWSWPLFARYYGAEEIHLVPEELAGNPDDVAKLMSANLEPYAKLAEKGDTEAMMIIGHYLNPRVPDGNPETKNADEALRWYTLGSEAGDSQCMKNRSRLLMTRNFLQAVYCQVMYHIMITRL